MIPLTCARSFRYHILPVLLFMVCAGPARAVDVEQYPELQALVRSLHEQYNYNETILRELFAQVEISPRVIRDTRHPGERRPWYKYRDQFVTALHARRGSRFWHKHAEALARAQKQYGVDPELVVAIIGIESRYGRNIGHLRVIDTLTTQMLTHPERKDFFSRELMQFLLFVREHRLHPLAIRGSYAGAIGMAQFIPSTYRSYAVDFDDDGRADLMNSVPDAIGSVANYFHQHGWMAGQPVCDEARTHGDMAPWLSDLGTGPLLTLDQLANFGIVPAHRKPDPHLRAAMMELEGRRGMEHRLVFHNFFVVRRYNHNDKYAMAVCDLSRMIRRRYIPGKSS